MRRLASSRLSLWLGKISFPLFLIQFPVLLSVTSGLIVLAGPEHVRAFSFLIASLSIAVAILAATAFQPVEIVTRAIENQIVAGARIAAAGISGFYGPSEQAALAQRLGAGFVSTTAAARRLDRGRIKSFRPDGTQTAAPRPEAERSRPYSAASRNSDCSASSRRNASSRLAM